jgi:hypothetical protein
VNEKLTVNVFENQRGLSIGLIRHNRKHYDEKEDDLQVIFITKKNNPKHS